MVKLKRFEIVFNSPEDAFFAGQDILGKLIVESTHHKKVNQILLEIKGRPKTYWSKGSGKNVKHVDGVSHTSLNNSTPIILTN